MSRSSVNFEPGLFRQVFKSSPDPAWIIDVDGDRLIECNEAAVSTLGYSNRKDFLDIHPSKLSPLRQPDGEDSFVKYERMVAIAKTGGFHRFEWMHIKADGTNLVAEATLFPVVLNNRQVIICIGRDIAERRQSEQALLDIKQRYDDLVSKIPFGVYILHSTQEGDFALDYVSPRSAEIFNASVESLLADFDIVLQAIHPDDRDNFAQLNLDGIKQLQPFNWDGRIQVGKAVKWLHIASSPDPQENGDVLWHGIVEDITKRKQMEDQIRQLAFHDVLTALPNRRLLNERLQQAMAVNKRNGCYGVLIFLDLDNFKPLNDSQGHEVGDLLLIEVANRLKGCVRNIDIVARFGGDEFVVMVSELGVDKSESIVQADIIANRISAELARPYVLQVRHEGAVETSVEHCSTASLGVVLFGKNDISPDNIIKWADMAMYEAKESGRSLIRFYDLTTEEEARDLVNAIGPSPHVNPIN